MADPALHACMRLVEEVSRKPEAAFFLHPPDASVYSLFPSYLRVIYPHEPTSISQLQEAYASGALPNTAAVVTELRRVFLVALRFFCEYKLLPHRQNALKCLSFVDDHISKNHEIRESYAYYAGRAWVVPKEAFPNAKACRTALEMLLKEADAYSVFYPPETYYPEGDFFADYGHFIREKSNLSDVSERLYDCQVKVGGTSVGAQGPFESADNMQRATCLVFDNVVTFFHDSQPELTNTALKCKQIFQNALQQAIAAANQARRISGGDASASATRDSSPAPSPTYTDESAAAAKQHSKPPAPMSDEMKKRCLRFIEKIKTTPHRFPLINMDLVPATYFIDPVTDAVAKGYSEVIKTPMCIRFIEQKIMNGEYLTPQDMKADLQLIVTNCLTYNEDTLENADIRALGIGFQAVFTNKFRSAFPSDAPPVVDQPKVVKKPKAQAAKPLAAPAPAPAPFPPFPGFGSEAPQSTLASSGVKLVLKRSAAPAAPPAESQALADSIRFPAPVPVRAVADNRPAHAVSFAEPSMSSSSVFPPFQQQAHQTEFAASTGPKKLVLRTSESSSAPSAAPPPPPEPQGYDRYMYSRTPEFQAMVHPKQLRDLRMVPVGWPYPDDWESAEDKETTDVWKLRESYMNMSHNMLITIKQHPWEPFFRHTWRDVAPAAYLIYTQAQLQHRALLDIYERLRMQLPRRQGTTAGGKPSRPPKPKVLQRISDAYVIWLRSAHPPLLPINATTNVSLQILECGGADQ
jgi:hypothetical protein